MKKALFLFSIFICSLSSSSQILNFNKKTYDISRLSFKNSFFEQKLDTIGVSENYQGTLIDCHNGIYASNNLKYFLVFIDTTCVGPIGIPTGCDTPTRTHFSFYLGQKLMWSKFLENSISEVHFFENDGTCLIKWSNPWSENHSLFYNINGKTFDTLSTDCFLYYLDNSKVLIRKYPYVTNDIKCINSKNEVIWTGKDFFRNNTVYNNLLVSDNGKKIIIESVDSIYSFNSNLKLVWSSVKNKFYTSSISNSGDYYLKLTNFLYKNSNRVNYSMLSIFDNNSGKQLSQFDSLLVDNKHIKYYDCHFIENSDYLCIRYEVNNNGNRYLLFKNIKGEILGHSVVPSGRWYPTIYYRDEYIKVYLNNELFEKIKIKN